MMMVVMGGGGCGCGALSQNTRVPALGPDSGLAPSQPWLMKPEIEAFCRKQGQRERI
jgi:S-formylglutathione hydrolase FrmB